MTSDVTEEVKKTKSPVWDDRFSFPLRFFLVFSGAIPIILLAIASQLEPNSKGYGTHQQISLPIPLEGMPKTLPPCSFKVMTGGKPCPSCGMTTSWANLMKGRVINSWNANPGGMFLGLAAIFFGPWMFVSGLAGKWIVAPPSERLLIFGSLLIFGTTLATWIVRLFF